MVPENDTCQIQNFDFISHVFGPAAQSGQARTPTQLTLHMGACWGTRSRQTVVLNKEVSRTQLYQKSRDPFQLWFHEYLPPIQETVLCRHHLPASVLHVYLQVQIWETGLSLSHHAYLYHHCLWHNFNYRDKATECYHPVSFTLWYISIFPEQPISDSTASRRMTPITCGAPNSPHTI